MIQYGMGLGSHWLFPLSGSSNARLGPLFASGTLNTITHSFLLRPLSYFAPFTPAIPANYSILALLFTRRQLRRTQHDRAR